MLVRLIYASRAAQTATPQVLNDILSQSHKNNPVHGITGLLLANNSVFMQVLEGSRIEVNKLYTTIVRDPRHTDVCLLQYQDVDERMFVNWSMGNVRLDQINPAIILKYSSGRDLDPFNLSGDAMQMLIGELVTAGAVVCK
jgi:Sensors of blue-light using FAD